MIVRSPFSSVPALLNMSMRGLGLVARFALMIVITRAYGLGALGTFGLILGATGMAPAFLGFGLNYFVGREVVKLSPSDGVKLIRTRLVISLGVILLAAIFAGIFAIINNLLPISLVLIFCIIFILECIGLDMHMMLIAQQKSMTANFSLFIRSALWVLPFSIIAQIKDYLVGIELLYSLWLIGAAISVVISCVSIFRVSGLWGATDFRAVRDFSRRWWLVYANDIGIVGQIYLDRYIISWLLTANDVGKYTLNFTLTNAVVILVSTGLIQTSAPKLILALRESVGVWRREMLSQVRAVGLLSAALAISVGGTALLLFPRIGLQQYASTPTLLAAMLAACIVKSVSDQVGIGLYSQGKDVEFSLLNIAGMIISSVLTIIFVHEFGLFGVGLSLIATPILLIVMRAHVAGLFRSTAS